MKIKKEMHHIHDKSYKDLFSNKELLVNMIQSFVESSWGKEITEDNIELVNKSYILSYQVSRKLLTSTLEVQKFPYTSLIRIKKC